MSLIAERIRCINSRFPNQTDAFGYPSLIAWSDPGAMDSDVQIEISDYAPK